MSLKKSLIGVTVCLFLISCGKNEARNDMKEMKEMMCDIAKGEAISKCVNMQVGATGMANCQGAVSTANVACERTDLTIIKIMEEASKGNNISPSPGTEKKTSERENIKSDDAVNNPQSAQSLDSCRKVGEARFNSAVAERCSGTWNIYASIPNGGVWYSDKMGNDPAAKQINNQANKVEERLRGCGLVVHISLSNWFDSFTSNLVVVHSSPHPSAVEAAEELKRMKQCGIDGYSKKSEYQVVGRD